MTPTKVKIAQSPLRKYIDEADDLPADVLLGRIVLFTISDEPVKRSDMEQWFIELDLDLDFLPCENKRIDAFKKATSAVKDDYPMSKGRTGILLCRDVAANGDFIRRQITREIKDGSKRRLSYDPAIEITFYRPLDGRDHSARLVTVPNADHLEPDEVPRVRAVAQQIYEDYTKNYEFLDGQKTRACIRNYLKHLNAIEIKGGVYFVHATRDKELAALSELVSRFGGECAMNTIPMVDLERERSFISKVFQREASQALSEIRKECELLRTSRQKITPAAYAKLKARYDEILNNAEEHTTNLQITQDVTAAAAEVAFNALLELQEEMIK